MRIYTCITILLCFCLFFACSRDRRYDDVRAYIDEMEKYLDEYADTLSRAESAEEVAAAIDRYIVKMTEFAERSSDLARKYPELARDEIPAELKADFERLNKTANSLADRVSGPLEKYMSHPAVLDAILKRADRQKDIIGMGMEK